MSEHFSTVELSCHHCGRMEFREEDIARLELLRVLFTDPMRITSGYRCPEHNAAVSKTGPNGPHTIFAVDVAVSGGKAMRLIRLALEQGWTGIGIKQHGPVPSRYVHLDRLPAGGAMHPRPWVWSYT